MLAFVAGWSFAIARKTAVETSSIWMMSMQPVHAKSATYVLFGTSSAMQLNANTGTGMFHALEAAVTTTWCQMDMSGGAHDPSETSQRTYLSKFFTE